ncbi:MAG: UDP-N-acetylmuramate--L-alanine ligase, partial [Silvibacterium sp.]
IYAASEEPIEGISSEVLVRTVGLDRVEFAASAEEAIARVVKRAEDGDVILTQGAGSISQIAPQVLERLGR